MQAVSTWRLDPGSRLRAAGLAGVAIGSWVGGALIERFVDAALG